MNTDMNTTLEQMAAGHGGDGAGQGLSGPPAPCSRRSALAAGLGLGLLAAVPWAAAGTLGSADAPIQVMVWKGPACGCCKDWVRHLEAHGFQVQVRDEGNTDARRRLGIPDSLGSCHTALVGGYAIEGHVPAREIKRLLKERPKARGLAVPGMPIGSPGMDGPEYGPRQDPYEVLLVQTDGRVKTFQRYP